MQQFETSQSSGSHDARRTSLLRAVCWRLRLGDSQATCSLYATVAQWQLQLDVNGEIQQVQFFEDQSHWIAAAVKWRKDLGSQGWR